MNEKRKTKNPMTREPETLSELRDCIIWQLRTSESVTINLTDGDGLHELLASIDDGIKGTKALNAVYSI